MEMNAKLTADVMENILKHGKFNIPTRNAMENAVRLLKEQPEWIPCKDRNPEQYQLVIVLIFGHDMIIQQEGETLEDAIRRTMNISRTSCGYLGEEGWCGSDGYPMIVQPSYWMKIPKPPEREFLTHI